LPPGAHDFDLEVPTAGCAPGVVRGSARGGGAGVGTGKNGQVPRRTRLLRESPGHDPSFFDDPEAISLELTGFGWVRSLRPSAPAIPMGAASIGLAVSGQEPAGNLEHGVVVQVLLVPLQVSQEGDALGMSEEKGGLVVSRRGITAVIVQGRDAERHPEAITVRTHGATGWGRVVRGAHPVKDRAFHAGIAGLDYVGAVVPWFFSITSWLGGLLE